MLGNALPCTAQVPGLSMSRAGTKLFAHSLTAVAGNLLFIFIVEFAQSPGHDDGTGDA